MNSVKKNSNNNFILFSQILCIIWDLSDTRSGFGWKINIAVYKNCDHSKTMKKKVEFKLFDLLGLQILFHEIYLI